MKIKTPYNSSEFPKYRETFTRPSMTQPDQTMTLKELLDRHQRGLPIEGEKFPIYHGEDEEVPDLKKMDLSEIHDLKQEIAERIRQQQQELQQIETDARKEAAKQHQLEQFKKWQDEQNKEAQQPK